MKYQEFVRNINFGNYTAFVYDSPRNRFQYSSGEINDDVFEYIEPNTEFRIEPLDNYEVVKEIIISNFLPELKPAYGIIDEYFDAVKSLIETGIARLGIWNEVTGQENENSTTYMLIL